MVQRRIRCQGSSKDMRVSPAMLTLKPLAEQCVMFVLPVFFFSLLFFFSLPRRAGTPNLPRMQLLRPPLSVIHLASPMASENPQSGAPGPWTAAKFEALLVVKLTREGRNGAVTSMTKPPSPPHSAGGKTGQFLALYYASLGDAGTLAGSASQPLWEPSGTRVPRSTDAPKFIPKFPTKRRVGHEKKDQPPLTRRVVGFPLISSLETSSFPRIPAWPPQALSSAAVPFVPGILLRPSTPRPRSPPLETLDLAIVHSPPSRN